MGRPCLEPLDQGNEADVLFVYEARRHPAVAPLLFGTPPESLEAHREWLRANVPVRRLMFVLKEDGVPVGYCHAVPKETEVELGFVVHPDHQGNGMGGFMVWALADTVVVRFPGKKVVLKVRADNERARRLYERSGFVERERFEDGGVEKVVYELK